jgi:hypothetical protein
MKNNKKKECRSYFVQGVSPLIQVKGASDRGMNQERAGDGGRVSLAAA